MGHPGRSATLLESPTTKAIQIFLPCIHQTKWKQVVVTLRFKPICPFDNLLDAETHGCPAGEGFGGLIDRCVFYSTFQAVLTNYTIGC